MSADGPLSSVTLLSSTVAATGTAYPLNWRWGGDTQTRRIVTVLANGSDTVTIQATVDGGANYFTINTAHTATTTAFVDTITGPYTHVRALKTGANGAATVVGLL